MVLFASTSLYLFSRFLKAGRCADAADIISVWGDALSLWAVLFGDRCLHLNLRATKIKSRIGFIFLLPRFGALCHTVLKKQSQCYGLQSWFNDLNISFCPDTHYCRI